MSTWVYGCKLGLYQDTCGRYEQDTSSRGQRAQIGGCPSCVHREPGSDATRQADQEHAAAVVAK